VNHRTSWIALACLVNAGLLAQAPQQVASLQVSCPVPASGGGVSTASRGNQQKPFEELTPEEQRDALLGELEAADQARDADAARDYALRVADALSDYTAMTSSGSSSSAGFALGFTGHEQTDSSGLVYMKGRFYMPWYGKFMTPDHPGVDQHREQPQSWNLYTYARNNPVMNVDPTGWDVVSDGFVGPLPMGTYHASTFAKMIQPRSAWDAYPANTGRGWERDPNKTMITVHDTGESGAYRDMKSIQELHMEKGTSAKVLYRETVQGQPAYNDIGYHFGISPGGAIYEGRPVDIKGSHVEGQNTGNVGIVLLDSYRGEGQLPAPMAEALKNLMQYLEIQYPAIQGNIETHGQRNQDAGNGRNTTEASQALPVIQEERDKQKQQ